MTTQVESYGDVVCDMHDGFPEDITVLEHVAPSRPRYVGLIGSRRKIAGAFRALEGRGIAGEFLASVHAPIGLDIGAETPAEIAVAVGAEIVTVLRNRSGARAGRPRAAAP